MHVLPTGQLAPAWRSFLKLLDCLEELATHLVQVGRLHPSKGVVTVSRARAAGQMQEERAHAAGTLVPNRPARCPALRAPLPQDGWAEIERLHPAASLEGEAGTGAAQLADAPATEGPGGSPASWEWLEVLWARALTHEYQQASAAAGGRARARKHGLRGPCMRGPLAWCAPRSQPAVLLRCCRALMLPLRLRFSCPMCRSKRGC